jgi:hypothetical protein
MPVWLIFCTPHAALG